MGPGFTDESNGTVFGTIHVEEVEQQLESAERIQVMLADKEQVKRILKEERVTLLRGLSYDDVDGSERVGCFVEFLIKFYF